MAITIDGDGTITGLSAGGLPNNSVQTADIADDQITLAKLAGGTDGQIITYDASGNPVAVGPGSDGQILTSTGPGSPPAFEAAPGGTCVLVGRTVVSSGSAAEIDIEDTSLFDGTYDRIVLSFSAIRLSTDSSFVMGRLKYGGSYQTSSHYNYHTRHWKGNAEAVHSGSTTYEDNGDNFHFFKETGNATGESAAMEVTIWNPGNTSVWKMIEWTGTMSQKDSRAYIMRGGGYYHNTSTGQGVMQGFKLYTTSDSGGTSNITDLIVNKYGWKIS